MSVTHLDTFRATRTDALADAATEPVTAPVTGPVAAPVTEPTTEARTGAMTGATTEPGRAPAISAPEQLAMVGARVEPHLDALFTRETRRWGEVDESLVLPLQSLRRLVLQGGKRLRPTFCYWGFVAAGGTPNAPADAERLDRAAAAFELLHAFALIHDDVMDDAPQRRGIVTAHVEYGERHAVGDWRGEQRRFGESVAILLGDLAHVYAEQLMSAARPGPAAAAIWRDLQTELMMGQYLDVVGTARADRSPERARLVALLKSGRYTIERPLQLGAALVDAAPATLTAPPRAPSAAMPRCCFSMPTGGPSTAR